MLKETAQKANFLSKNVTSGSDLPWEGIAGELLFSSVCQVFPWYQAVAADNSPPSPYQAFQIPECAKRRKGLSQTTRPFVFGGSSPAHEENSKLSDKLQHHTPGLWDALGAKQEGQSRTSNTQ